MKRDWSDGYVADVTYSHGYFHELAPSYLRYHLLVNGYASPSAGQNYTYCELGFGQGVSANLHAATNPRGKFWGTDFNPNHALYARSIAERAGIEAHWLGQSFEEMIDTATPQFDFIAIHGVWSWVSPAAQHALVEFMRRKLKPGGAVFMSYNVLPGWNDEKPLRDLLWLHTEHGSAAGAPTPRRIANALHFAKQLRQHGCAYFTDNSRASQALDEMLRQDPGGLAHEYFNSAWCLTYFAEVERALQAASLDFACSVHISDIVGEVRERLAGAGFVDPSVGAPLRETTADFVLNRRFRRDVFLRGAIRLAPRERLAALNEVSFVPLRAAAAVSMFLNTPYGQLPLDEGSVKPILEALEGAPQPVSLAQLREAPEIAARPAEETVMTLSRLVARRDIAPIFPEDASRAGHSRAAALNAVIADRAAHDDSLRYLASPVANCAIEASRYERLFWSGWHGGARTAADLAGAASVRLGETVSRRSEQVEGIATQFLESAAPVWKRLGVLAE